MSALVFVDTNVLVYARDSGQADKQARAAEWMEMLWVTGRGRLSFQVLHEFYVTVTQKLRPGLAPDVARREVRSLLAWDPVSSRASVLEHAWLLEDRFSISWWDALIVSAARAAGCAYLLTEDLQAGQDLDGVQALHPFEGDPHSYLARG